MIFPVIMAGGSGTRLWPLSRELNPKQFLALVDDQVTMLQATLQRLEGLEMAPPLLVCNEEHRFLAAEQLRQIDVENATILLESVSRNTAPAIAVAAMQAMGFDDDPVLLVLPADHVIQDEVLFRSCITRSLTLAEAGKMVAFGVNPAHPETGYGYIQKGDPVSEGFAIKRFVEKPDFQTAERYLKNGDFLWNSGMFMFRASSYLTALRRFRPDILEACEHAFEGRKSDLDFVRVGSDAFRTCPQESIDYAVFEPLSELSDDAVVVPLDVGWSDIGSWSALWSISDKDNEGNVHKGDVLNKDSQQCFVQAKHRLVATLGVKSLIVIETKDAVLIADKSKVQEVKEIVKLIRKEGRHEHKIHREVYRPWGMYDSVDSGHRYQVKRITVNPGEKLSLQMHYHRAEHWVVVSGTAEVRSGDETFMVSENQSTYIPVGCVHSLRNPGVIPLELIEVQSGSYLGEDDIVRFEDNYGRVNS